MTMKLYGFIHYERDSGLSDRSYDGKTRPLTTRVEVAALLDDAAFAAISEAGSYGAATAWAMLAYDADGEDCERLRDLGHPDVAALPVGTAAEARKLLRERRGDTAWNGQNRVPHPIANIEGVLAFIRAQ